MTQNDKNLRLHDRAIEGLIRRVRGFMFREVKTTFEVDGAGERRVKSEVVTRRRSEPDLNAIIFTLTNLDGDRWRAKPEAREEAERLPDLSAMNEDALRLLAENYPKQ